MDGINYFSAFLIGLAGGVHCVGMCGGIVAALRMVSPKGASALPYTLAYNMGRITSYTLGVAITCALGKSAADFVPLAKYSRALLSGIMLLLLACYLGKWWTGLSVLENAGKGLFAKLQPLSKRFLPFKTPLSAVPYGFIWGASGRFKSTIAAKYSLSLSRALFASARSSHRSHVKWGLSSISLLTIFRTVELSSTTRTLYMWSTLNILALIITNKRKKSPLKEGVSYLCLNQLVKWNH